MIQRKISGEIQKDLLYFPAIGIVGPRQSGKTTLAKMLMGQLAKETLYIDLESEADVYRLQDPESYLLAQSHKCVVIDEIQLMPRLFPLLRSVIDSNRVPARFVLLGSASPELIRGASESLAGRVAFHEIAPFSLPELEGQTTLRQHWFRGGYPLSVLAPNDGHGCSLDGQLLALIRRA